MRSLESFIQDLSLQGARGRRIAVVQDAVTSILLALGVDLDNPHAKDTPNRVAKMYVDELCSSLGRDPDFLFPRAKDGSRKGVFPNDGINQMVSVREIPFYSLCEHHWVSFFGVAHIGYVPNEKILGLSKFARVIDFFSRRPQTQENLTQDITAYLAGLLDPLGLICMMEGRHLCMEARGVQKAGAITTTTSIWGDFDKTEFMSQLYASKMRP